MLQHCVAHHPPWIAAASLPSQSLLKKQQNLAERSCTEAALTKDSEGRRKESKKGLRFDQNILLNIPLQRARPKEAEITQRRDPKPMHIKFTWSTSFSQKKSCCIKVTLLYDF
ncbi:hypothetical protein V6N13_040291 [Hibiscus sabdariffa]